MVILCLSVTVRSTWLIWYPCCHTFGILYDRHKCHKMTFYGIYDGHKMSYDSIKVSVFIDWEIKKTKLVILQIFPFVLPFIKWGSLEGTLIHYQWKKQNYFWAQYTIGRQIKHFLNFSLRKRGEWHTLMLQHSITVICYSNVLAEWHI